MYTNYGRGGNIHESQSDVLETFHRPAKGHLGRKPGAQLDCRSWLLHDLYKR